MYTHKILNNQNALTSVTFRGLQPRTKQRILVAGSALPLRIKAGLEGASSDGSVADRMIVISENWVAPGFLVLEDLVADTLEVEITGTVPPTYALEIVLDSY